MHASGDSVTGFEPALAGRRVLLTGHTGFTGGWLALWLRAIGCDVTGLALPPERITTTSSKWHWKSMR